MNKSQPFHLNLFNAGWLSPDTYTNFFASLPDSPGIYLITRLFVERPIFKENVVYVGMSKNLRKRHEAHEIRAMMDFSTRVFFKKFPLDSLRQKERELIRFYNPSFNIVHRVRGS